MKFNAVSTLLFRAKPCGDKEYSMLKYFGIQKIEFSARNGFIDLDSPKSIHEQVKLLEKYNIEVNSVHGKGGNPELGNWLCSNNLHEQKLTREYYYRLVDFAKAVNSQYIIIEYECFPYWPYNLSNQLIDISDYEYLIPIWKNNVKYILDYSVKMGIGIALENMEGFEILQFYKDVKSFSCNKIGICLDTSHLTYNYNKQKFIDDVQFMMPYIVTTHLSDNDGLKGSQWEDRHWPPYQGIIDWEKLELTFSSLNYKGDYVLEVCSNYDALEVLELMQTQGCI